MRRRQQLYGRESNQLTNLILDALTNSKHIASSKEYTNKLLAVGKYTSMEERNWGVKRRRYQDKFRNRELLKLCGTVVDLYRRLPKRTQSLSYVSPSAQRAIEEKCVAIELVRPGATLHIFLNIAVYLLQLQTAPQGIHLRTGSAKVGSNDRL